jgi:Holliday junction resolvase RusA-like endonuclease
MELVLNGHQRFVKILNMPLPPSVNQAYNPFKGRMIKDKNLRGYESSAEQAMIRSGMAPQLKLIKPLICPLPSDICAVEINFKFQYSRLFCKTADKKTGRKLGDVKSCDLDNRLKGKIDFLKKIIGFDDSHFFEIIARKVPVMNLEDEGVDVIMRPMSLHKVD